MGFFNSKQSLGMASIILAMSVLLSRFTGLIRDKVISYFHGASLESDVYFASFVIPDLLFYLLAGGYFTITLIPIMAARFKNGPEDGWRFMSTILTWVFIASTIMVIVGIVESHALARLVAPGFDEEGTRRLASFLRIILPGQIFFLLGTCLSARLYLRREFIAPALTPIIYNFAIIILGIIWSGDGMEGFCYGVVAGSFFGVFLLPLVCVAKGERLLFRPRLFDPDLKKFIILSLPLMLGQSIVVLEEQLYRVFGSLLSSGAVSWLTYARRVMLVPLGVVAHAAGVASFPFLAKLIADNDRTRFDQTVSRTINISLFLLIPMSVWMIICAEPIIRLIFQQGQFGQTDTVMTATLLRIMLVTLFCWAIHQMISRAFYANQNTLIPAIIGTLGTVVALPAYYLMAERFGSVGIAVTGAATVAAYTLVTCLVWQRKYKGQAMAGLPRTFLITLACTIIPGLVSFGLTYPLAELFPGHPLASAFVELLINGTCFCLIFFACAMFMAPQLMRPILDRLRRKKQS